MERSIDREKVIKGLEHCSSGDGCKGCPYSQSENGHVCSFNCIREAIVLLKEQKTVETIAIKKEMFDEYYGAVACCPKCDCMWIMYMDNDMHYCPECGQAVKWE